MSESKIQIKVGVIEFSGEGNQDWLSLQLDKILEKVPELLKIETLAPQKPTEAKSNGSHDNNDQQLNLSLLNIAGKLNVKSASELTIASAAFLHFTENKPAFSRDDLSSTMKKATGFYKESMMSNLTKTLTQLERNGTFNKSSNQYSIQAAKVSELNAVLSK